MADPQQSAAPPPPPDGSAVVSNIPPPPDGSKAVATSLTPEEQARITGESVVKAAPPWYSPEGLISTGHWALRHAIDELPTAGGMAGAIATAPGGPGASIVGAGLGGVAGESARQLSRQALGLEVPTTAADTAKELVTQGASNMLAEGTGQAGARLFKPLRQTFEQTAIRGSKIPLLPGEADTMGPGLAKAVRFTEHALPSMQIMKEFRERQAAAVNNAIEDQLGQISNFKGTPEELGKATQQAIQNARTVMKDEVNSAYGALDALTKSKIETIHYPEEVPTSIIGPDGQPMTKIVEKARKEYVGGAMPETAGVKKTAGKLLEEINQQKLLMDPVLLGDSERMLDTIMKAPDQVPFQTMAKTRSDLLALTRKLDEALPGKRAGIAKSLVSDIDSAMETAASKAGVLDQFRAANALTKDMHEKFEQQLVTKILDSGKPEMVAGYVKDAGLQELRDLNGLMTKTPDGVLKQRALQTGVVRDILQNAPEPAKFAEKFNQLGEEKAKILFGQNYDSLKKLSDLLSRVNPKTGGANIMSSMHNWTYISTLPAAAVSLGAGIATGHPLAGAAVAGAGLTKMAGETIFMQKLARALTNPARSAETVAKIQAVMHYGPYALPALYNFVSSEPTPLGTEGLQLPSVPSAIPPRGTLPDTQPGKGSMPPPPARSR